MISASSSSLLLFIVVCFWTIGDMSVISLMFSGPTSHRIAVDNIISFICSGNPSYHRKNRGGGSSRKFSGLQAFMNKDGMEPPLHKTSKRRRDFARCSNTFILATNRQEDEDTTTTDQEEQDDSSKEGKGDTDINEILLDILCPSKYCKVNRMGGTDLAYIGDVVFELYVRSKLVWPSRRTSDLQNLAVSIVRAENQSSLLAQIKKDFPLTEAETQIVSRGRNAVTRSKNRRNPAAYQDSTAFEALIGYLYITDRSRCNELFEFLESIITID